jgi:hypothetical protein
MRGQEEGTRRGGNAAARGLVGSASDKGTTTAQSVCEGESERWRSRLRMGENEWAQTWAEGVLDLTHPRIPDMSSICEVCPSAPNFGLLIPNPFSVIS